MKIPFKQMTSWKAGTLAPFLLGVWYILAPWFFGKVFDQKQAVLGFTFLSIALIKAKTKPMVLSGFATAFIGISYILFSYTTIAQSILWMFSAAAFVAVLVFELEIFSFGPAREQVKDFTIVPITVLAFVILLGIAGYNPFIRLDWTRQTLVALNYIFILAFCVLFVCDRVGYEPFKKSNNAYMNVVAILALALNFIGIAQGTLFAL